MVKLDPIGWGELFSLLAVIISFVTICLSIFARSKSNTQSEQQVLDRLDNLGTVTKETNIDVKEVSKKIDDHSERLASLEARVDNAFFRIKRVEETQDHCQACRASKQSLGQI